LAAVDAVARSFGVAAGDVANQRSIGNDGAPQCAMRTRSKHGGPVEVIANVERTQGAYFIVERTIEEASQIFGTPRMEPAPVMVSHLGLAASWFPQWQWLISTDGYRVVTTTVDWAGAKQAQKIAVATRISLLYLHTPHGKQAAAVANNYP
jgi:hypothetical protein